MCLPFEELTKEEIGYLSAMNDIVRLGRNGLAALVRKYRSFICTSWDKNRIGAAITIVRDASKQCLTVETHNIIGPQNPAILRRLWWLNPISRFFQK
jgi:hypothetical protein